MAEFNKEDFRETVRNILREYKASYKEISEQVVDKVLEKMNSGKNISEAVKEALSETAFFDVNKQAVVDAVYLAACAGYGVLPSIVANADSLKDKLLSDSWAPDKMNLSKRLHGSNRVMRQMIIDTIRASMLNGQSVKEMAMKLYDGYNSGKGVIRQADVPAYLSKIEALARLAANRDPEIMKQYQNAVNSFRKQIDSLETGNLKAAYRQFIQAAEQLDTQSMEKAVRVAMEEKTRYYAERIARTESVRAWFDGFIAENQDNDEVWGYRWVLSSRHSRVPFDQCDVCANMNVGWGKGVYPKNRVPSIPRHPHCMCMLEVVFGWEVINKENQLDEAGARDYIDNLDDNHKMQLFGTAGTKQYKAGADWQTLLRGWNGFEQPKSRLSKADFDLQLFVESGIIKEKLIADIKATGIKCLAINYPPKLIDVDSLSFDDEHINKERQHGVTEAEAKEIIRNAIVSLTKWGGMYEHYYSDKGVVYVDFVNKVIRTCYKEKEFGNDIVTVQEVLKSYVKRYRKSEDINCVLPNKR